MPPNVLRCRTCGAALNAELKSRPVDAPESCALPEVKVMLQLVPKGYFIGCPNCEQELRIAGKYLGNKVQCKFCSAPFIFSFSNPSMRQLALYGDCPHCRKELRIAMKYAGKRVGCKLCNGALHIAESDRKA
jgi:hypothetical protein